MRSVRCILRTELSLNYAWNYYCSAMDPEDCQVMNSKPSDPRQRRPDGRMYFVENEEQSGSDDWQIANVVDWRRQRLECSSRPWYLGALFRRHRWTVTASLYCTRSGTLSQCSTSCRRRDRPWSNLRVPETKRAAAFSTRWSVSVILRWSGKHGIAVIHTRHDEGVESMSKDRRTLKMLLKVFSSLCP